MKRIGVNANQIARRYNMEAKNARPWSTMSAPAGTREDVKSFEEFTQELRKTNTLLEQLNESVRKQTMEMQLSELYPEVRALLEDFGDATHLPDVVDELSRANGLQVLGADKSHTTWEERSATLDAKSFDRHLGDKIAFARDNADSMEAFKKNLEYAGVTLTETAKTDKKTGEVTTGWSYKAKDVWGPKMRTRKRRASNLCDDFTKDGIEAYFEEKQAQAEEQAQKAPTEPEVVAAVPEDVPQDVRTHQSPEPEPIPAVPEPDTPQEDFHVYEPSADDVSDMAGDLRRAYVRHCEGKGQNYMDDTYHRFVSVQADPHDAWLELHAEVARAREEFHRTKAELDAVKQQRKDFAVGMAIFRAVNRKSQSPMARMMADMYAMMFQQMMQAKREEAERKLYERRKAMWDAEKALKNELKRGEIGYKPHELPESLKRITEGYGRSDDDKSLGDW